MLEVHSATHKREGLAVIKIGGSILTGSRAYRRAAIFIRNRHRASPRERLVVVVSAQDGATDALERTARRIANPADPVALDLLWSTGELRSVSLLALHLQALGIAAAALNVHEAGLRLPLSEHDAGTVLLNDPVRLRHALKHHSVAIVPGFLAINLQGSVVSLGRGGSDLTAVLLAEGLGASRCELIKDVAGYFSCDPHRDPAARHLPHPTPVPCHHCSPRRCACHQATRSPHRRRQNALYMYTMSFPHQESGSQQAFSALEKAQTT